MNTGVFYSVNYLIFFYRVYGLHAVSCTLQRVKHATYEFNLKSKGLTNQFHVFITNKLAQHGTCK